MPNLRILIFLVVITAITAGLYFYIGWRLIRPARLGAPAKRALWALVALLALSVPVTFVGGRYIAPGPAAKGLAWFGFSALGLMGIFAALVILRDLFLTATIPIKDPSRRELLRRASGFVVLGAGGFIAVRSIVLAARPPVVERVTVPVTGLPSALEGLRIVQISDLHLGPTLGRPFLEGVVQKVNDLDADIVAVTGDLADGYVEPMRGIVEPIKDLRAKLGVYFVTGNHEYYWNAEEWVDCVRGLGLDVLVNEHRVIERDGARIVVGGVTDLSAGQTLPAHESDVKKAFSGAGDADFRLLLAHQPKSLYAAQRAGVDLQLCGHTHGGQVFPMSLLVHLAHPIVSGIGRFGPTWVYVNRGTAYWGPPMRTTGAGEITVVELAPEA